MTGVPPIGPAAPAEPSDVTVIVLAGGESRRFGSDKLAAELEGTTVLDHLISALPAWPVVCVGSRRPTSRAVTWTREDPPLGGPLAGIAAGVAASSTSIVAVVAGDMPWAGPAIGRLVDTLIAHPAAAAVVARDDEGAENPLLAAYRRAHLAAALPVPAHGRRAKLLLEIPHMGLLVAGRLGRDVDTRADLPASGPGAH